MVEVFPPHHKEVFSPQLFLSPKPPPPVPIQLLVPSPLYSPQPSLPSDLGKSENPARQCVSLYTRPRSAAQWCPV